MSSINRKRIARNTALLYFRMLLIMVISLFTVRIVLQTLGVEDYGIYNVVAGIVVMFSFLSNTMASSSQRYFAFELGKEDYLRLKKVFSISLMVYFGIALVVLLLAETLGLWFLNTKMTIPPNRMEAANWIYQFSIFSFLITIITIPYNAVIIAREKMGIYAYVSIIEAALKLLIVYLLVFFSFDKLKLYGILLFGVTLIITGIYRTYCRKKYEECRFQFYRDKDFFKELIGYSGWNLYGALAGVFKNQGINILLNIFFGPIVNAARGVAFQVNSAINQFVSNFYTAVHPQITKSYAVGERKEMMNLVFQSSKFCFYLMLFLSVPVLIETPFILKLWLTELPDYVVIFTRLVILNTLIDAMSYPLITAAQATGKIMKYQLIVGSMLFLNLPLSYILLKFGLPPEITLYVSIVISILCLFMRAFMLRSMVGMSVRAYFTDVILIAFSVSVISLVLPVIIYINLEENLIRLLIVTVVSLLSTGISIWFLGLSKNERGFFIRQINKRFFHRK